MKSKFLSDVRQHAEASFASGLYCAESVVVALARAQGLAADQASKAATAFCSGMARTCGTCGALTGGIMGVSLALGRSKADESVEPAYEATQRLVHDFEQAFGARDCSELLGCDLGTPEGQRAFREQRLHERCARYTGTAAELAARAILASGVSDIGPLAEPDKARPLLSACDLPSSDLAACASLQLFGCRSDAGLAGVVGVELYGPVALLRSLAVAPEYSGIGLGKALVEHAEAVAAWRGVESLYLLTTTADTYFSRLGYAHASRDDAPAAIRATAQFSGLCPASSAFMSKRIEP
jgi:C_GCAxxG_C_C family probable redox protein